MEKIYQVDAFTSEEFKGNPAGVVIQTKARSAEWMLLMAKEMNLSETAFLLKQGNEYNLRWFTPAVEVDLCGHATLASAHVLFSEGYLKQHDTAIFNTASGELRAKYQEGWIELDFPAFQVAAVEVTKKIENALGFSPAMAFTSDVNLLVEMDKLDGVKNYLPKFRELESLPYQGLIITSRGKEGDYDFISRYFAPQVGIHEDPVTGSAHCSLVPYWAERLNKKEFLAYQASERGGVLKVKLANDRVLIQGQAVTIFTGCLSV
ncbi:MAG TPA: PhzF family phenazine biosynthesis isomerase [Pelolinea sp.]|nr:PhzF family phenazine biosynthesis isomerase [Pelolinea sp.]